MNISQGVLERILNVGTIDFDTAGTTDSKFAFDGVHRPERVVEAVDQAHREAESRQPPADGHASATGLE